MEKQDKGMRPMKMKCGLCGNIMCKKYGQCIQQQLKTCYKKKQKLKLMAQYQLNIQTTYKQYKQNKQQRQREKLKEKVGTRVKRITLKDNNRHIGKEKRQQRKIRNISKNRQII